LPIHTSREAPLSEAEAERSSRKPTPCEWLYRNLRHSGTVETHLYNCVEEIQTAFQMARYSLYNALLLARAHRDLVKSSALYRVPFGMQVQTQL
jgi:hypothetical protein